MMTTTVPFVEFRAALRTITHAALSLLPILCFTFHGSATILTDRNLCHVTFAANPIVHQHIVRAVVAGAFSNYPRLETAG
jgi:hypothetical protein